MRIPVLLLFALTAVQSCRTSRDTVEIQDKRAPTRPPSDDFPNVGRSVQTTFAVTAISLPTQDRAYEYLDLELIRSDVPDEVYRQTRYQPGKSFPIEPFLTYDVELTAFRGTSELFSTKFCRQRQTFKAQEGLNIFTASLCAKPETP